LSIQFPLIFHAHAKPPPNIQPNFKKGQQKKTRRRQCSTTGVSPPTSSVNISPATPFTNDHRCASTRQQRRNAPFLLAASSAVRDAQSPLTTPPRFEKRAVNTAIVEKFFAMVSSGPAISFIMMNLMMADRLVHGGRAADAVGMGWSAAAVPSVVLCGLIKVEATGRRACGLL
jgi:hypothetical protein